MTPWISTNLSTNEKLRVMVHPHWLWLLHPLSLIGYVLTLGLWLLWKRLAQQTHELVVTDKRVVMKAGVLVREVREMKLTSVESVEVSQSILGRMLNYGTVRVNGNGKDALIVKLIADPWAVQKAANS